MTTYTLAIGADMLLATVPDGGDLATAVAGEAVKSGFTVPAYDVVTGCALTDDEPDNRDTIVWRSGNCGWVIDESGRDWMFAVRTQG